VPAGFVIATHDLSKDVHGRGNLRWQRDTRGEMRDLDRVHAERQRSIATLATRR